MYLQGMLIALTYTLQTDLDFALLRWVVRQAGRGDVIALLVLDLVLLFHPRLPLLHFDLQRNTVVSWLGGKLLCADQMETLHSEEFGRVSL